VHAMRVNEDRVKTAEDAVVSALLEKETIAASSPPVGCVWPDQLRAKYTEEYVVGQGATACVYLAKYKGQTVAIKVAKASNNNFGMWQKECTEMQQLRLDACAKGGKAQQLAENFLPTCLEVAKSGSAVYYVMQAAGTTGISDFARTVQHDKVAQKHVFAQVVAAVFSLHGIGYTHNDLHGHNIVLNGNDVALIDFGEIKGHHRGLGYKHDANSVWRWAATLANCPEDAQFPRTMKSFFSKASKDELTRRSQNLLSCLKASWSADDEFINSFARILEDAIKITPDQHINLLWESKFVQDHVGKLSTVFPWNGNGRCAASGLAKKTLEPTQKKKPSGRPTVGSKVMDKRAKKCCEIIKDDGSSQPYKCKYADGKESLFLRKELVTWASECI